MRAVNGGFWALSGLSRPGPGLGLVVCKGRGLIGAPGLATSGLWGLIEGGPLPIYRGAGSKRRGPGLARGRAAGSSRGGALGVA